MEFLLQDLRYGLRILLKGRLLTASIVLILALGIGANSAMFAVLNALLLHGVPYSHPEDLAFVWSYDPQGQWNDLSGGDFADLRAQSKSLTDLAVWRPSTFVTLGGERPRQLDGARVTANFFRALDVKPVLGRTFLPDEDGLDHPEDASHSAVVSERFWRQDLGGDPNVLGRQIRVDSVSYSIVGVIPADFSFWWQPGDVWVPLSVKVHERDYHDLVVIARRHEPEGQADAELAAISRSLGEAYPKSDKGWTLRTEDFEERVISRTFRIRLWLLAAAVGLVLLIACTNVTNLLLARSAARARELAVRVALGARGTRLARQLLTESALFGLLGGGAGLATAWGLLRAMPKFMPAGALPGGPTPPSLPVLWFCVALSLVTCILVGAAPAVAALGSQPQLALQQGARGNVGARAGQRFSQTLVAAQVSVALMLLASAWLMIASMRALNRVEYGFDPRGVLAVRVVLPGAKYDAAKALRYYDAALEQLRTLPGVESASIGSSLPTDTNMLVRFDREDARHDANDRPSAPYYAVDCDDFLALRIPLKRGRYFTPHDNEKAPLVAMVSETFASRYFRNEDPVGKRIEADRPLRTGGQETVRLEIVGVVGDINVKEASFDSKAMIYVPYRQNPFTRGVWFSVRTQLDPMALGPAVRARLTSIDPEQPVEQVTTLEQKLFALSAEPRFQTGLMTAFASLALLLAAIGIYGVNAYAVTQRRGEIGLRMALGATRGAVLRDVIWRGLRSTAIGMGIGLGGSVGLLIRLKSVLVETDVSDPAAFLGATLLLGVVAAMACYLPARRALEIDPAITLRAE